MLDIIVGALEIVLLVPFERFRRWRRRRFGKTPVSEGR